jgi:hypothetical protein
MSIQLNTKTNIREDGSTKTYHYINVVFGEYGTENYEFEACGNVTDPKTYEKAMNKVKEILEREMYKRIADTQNKLDDYKRQYLVQDLDHITPTPSTMVEELDHKEVVEETMVEESYHITDEQILALWAPKYRTQEKLEAFRLYEQGMSLEDISEQLKLDPRTLQHWEKKFKPLL